MTREPEAKVHPPIPLRITAHSFTLQKSDASPWENEDAYACPGLSPKSPAQKPVSATTTTSRPRRVAVSDGVSNAWHSGAWSKALVWQFIRPGSSALNAFPAWLAEVQASWAKKPVDLSRTPGFLRSKVFRGAFATLLGVEFHEETDGGIVYQALAVGDSCLFHLRDGHLLRSFPLTTAEAFGSAPMTLPSAARFSANVLPHVATTGGDLAPGDRLLLATDALACHLLACAAVDPDWWLPMETRFKDATALRTYVADARATRRLADDDTTALLLCFDA